MLSKHKLEPWLREKRDGFQLRWEKGWSKFLDELEAEQGLWRRHLNDSTLSLINATGEGPGDWDSVSFWLQLKGFPYFLSLSLFFCTLSSTPERTCYPSSMIERRARNHNLKMASWGKPGIRPGREVWFKCKHCQEGWGEVKLDLNSLDRVPAHLSHSEGLSS